MIDWQRIDGVFGKRFAVGVGRPSKSTRLVVGLLLLRYLKKLSHRETVEAWAENGYWQCFCGEIYYSQEEPVDHTMLCKWVQRMKEPDLEALLRVTVQLAMQQGWAKKGELEHVNVDTTV